MIGIFSGRGIADTARVHAQIDVDFRKHLHEFNDGRSFSSLVLFLAIALHSNDHGWAWPGRDLLKQETGIKSETALTRGLAKLRLVTIQDMRIFSHYRQLYPDTKRWGKSAYLIFPELAHGPAPFDFMSEYDPAQKVKAYGPGKKYVYLIRTERGHKIGSTTHFNQRKRKIKSHYKEFEVLGIYETDDLDLQEGQWFNRFTRYHQRGDWFDLPDECVNQFITYCKNLPPTDLHVDNQHVHNPHTGNLSLKEEPEQSRTSTEEEPNLSLANSENFKNPDLDFLNHDPQAAYYEEVNALRAKRGQKLLKPQLTQKDDRDEPLTGEAYKQRIANATVQSKHIQTDMQSRWSGCFNTQPTNWASASNKKCLRFFIERDKAEEPIEQFAEWWYEHDWRGQKGQPPDYPAKVKELWAQAFSTPTQQQKLDKEYPNMAGAYD